MIRPSLAPANFIFLSYPKLIDKLDLFPRVACSLVRGARSWDGSRVGRVSGSSDCSNLRHQLDFVIPCVNPDHMLYVFRTEPTRQVCRGEKKWGMLLGRPAHNLRRKKEMFYLGSPVTPLK